MTFEEKTLADGKEQNRLEAIAADLKLRASSSIKEEMETIAHHTSIFGWSQVDRTRIAELQDELDRREKEQEKLDEEKAV